MVEVNILSKTSPDVVQHRPCGCHNSGVTINVSVFPCLTMFTVLWAASVYNNSPCLFMAISPGKSRHVDLTALRTDPLMSTHFINFPFPHIQTLSKLVHASLRGFSPFNGTLVNTLGILSNSFTCNLCTSFAGSSLGIGVCFSEALYFSNLMQRSLCIWYSPTSVEDLVFAYFFLNQLRWICNF